VEDNPDVREFASQMLNDLGFETHLAANAQDALALLDDDASDFDLIFSDVVMPGMSGLELAQRVKMDWPDLPVVLTSGYSHVLAEETGHGFTLLQKPYSVEGLSRSLREARQRAEPA
jgi:CheY-like chemotaxis protein